MTAQVQKRIWLQLALEVVCSAGGVRAAQTALFSYDPSGNTTVATLAISPPPTIVIQPQSQLLRNNGFVAFSIVALGGGLTYQWYSNDTAIAGATGDSLVLTGLSGTNFANYTVAVRNAGGAVTSAPPATIWLDSNVNGLPDWWELQFFGNLNQKPADDFDADGVSNADEYQEGSHPANSSQFNPRLAVQAAHGKVLVSPNLPFYTNGQFVSLTAVPDPGWGFLGWSGDSAGTKSPVSVLLNTNKTVIARFGLNLSVALNHAAPWATGGNASWFGQADIDHDAAGAAQSGPIWAGVAGDFVGQQTWLQTSTNVNEPIVVGFWWAVSCQPPDELTFAVNGIEYAAISGEALNWQYFETNLPAGNHFLSWTYSKGPTDLPSGVPFLDYAWLDQVTIAPATVPSQPPSLSIFLTSTNSVLITWPASSTGFRLQQTLGLLSPDWTDSTNSVLEVNGENVVLIPPENPGQFYRLVK